MMCAMKEKENFDMHEKKQVSSKKFMRCKKEKEIGESGLKVKTYSS